jgi:hypothetical protein
MATARSQDLMALIDSYVGTGVTIFLYEKLGKALAPDVEDVNRFCIHIERNGSNPSFDLIAEPYADLDFLERDGVGCVFPVFRTPFSDGGWRMT